MMSRSPQAEHEPGSSFKSLHTEYTLAVSPRKTTTIPITLLTAIFFAKCNLYYNNLTEFHIVNILDFDLWNKFYPRASHFFGFCFSMFGGAEGMEKGFKRKKRILWERGLGSGVGVFLGEFFWFLDWIIIDDDGLS